MSPREFFYLSALLFAWSVAFPCVTSRLNETARQETARFQIRVWQENGRALQHTQESLDAARKALEHDESKPALKL